MKDTTSERHLRFLIDTYVCVICVSMFKVILVWSVNYLIEAQRILFRSHIREREREIKRQDCRDREWEAKASDGYRETVSAKKRKD